MRACDRVIAYPTMIIHRPTIPRERGIGCVRMCEGLRVYLYVYVNICVFKSQSQSILPHDDNP